MTPVRLITLDPGHFHAALVQKEMYPGVDNLVHVYAPLGADVITHLHRIAGFNARKDNPTSWALEVHASPDFFERFLQEKPGNVVVLSGRNRAKIDYLLAAVRNGINVLADKPWVLTVADLAKLQQALDLAEANGLVAYDIMTERYEITSILQRELVNDAATFGDMVPGSADEPGVYMGSVHYLLKQVAGVPLRRPEWFFDIHQQGEGLTDVGTHLVDLAMWILFPEQAIDHTRDIRMVAARRWPTVLTKSDFEKITGASEFPATLAGNVRDGKLEYYCNNAVTYTLRGVHVKLDILWGLQAEPGAGDTHLAIVRGTKAAVEIRQGKEENFRPELFVVPQTGSADAVGRALSEKVARLQDRFPGVAAQQHGARWWVTIPDRYRVGHEAHFGEVTRQFLKYLEAPRTVPAWEKPNMLAKYFVTTQGVQMSQ
jgi:predicted dehydrogenase